MVDKAYKGVSRSTIENLQMVDVFKFDNRILGAMFKVTDEEGNDFKFALSSDIIENSDVIKSVFGCELNARVPVEVQVYVRDSSVQCVPFDSAVEVRECNLDYVYDAPQTKEGFIFIEGRKYKESDVIMFNVLQNVLSALEVCVKQRG